MRKVIISIQAHAAIISQAKGELAKGRPCPDGVEIELSEDTIERVEARRFPQESFSETLIRICNTAGRPLQ